MPFSLNSFNDLLTPAAANQHECDRDGEGISFMGEGYNFVIKNQIHGDKTLFYFVFHITFNEKILIENNLRRGTLSYECGMFNE